MTTSADTAAIEPTLVEQAARICESMACGPQFEPEIQDRMLRNAAKAIRALSTAPTTRSPAAYISQYNLDLLSNCAPCGRTALLFKSPDNENCVALYTAQTTGSAPGTVRVCPVSDIECSSTRECEATAWKCRKLAAPPANAPAASVLTDEQLDRLIVSSCHSDPWMASGEYCLSLDEVRALLAASMGGDRT